MLISECRAKRENAGIPVETALVHLPGEILLHL